MIFLAQQGEDGGLAVAEAVTDVHGSVWLLLGIGAIFIAARFFTAAVKSAVTIGVVIGLFVLMDGPGLSGSGIEQRWNDIKAKAEAFWTAEDVTFDRGGS